MKLFLLLFSCLVFGSYCGWITQNQKDKILKHLGYDKRYILLIDDHGKHGKCEVRTPCQIIIKNRRTGDCLEKNLVDGNVCFDPRCGFISRSKGVYDKYGEKGTCMMVNDPDEGLMVKGQKYTSKCFCDSGGNESLLNTS